MAATNNNGRHLIFGCIKKMKMQLSAWIPSNGHGRSSGLHFCSMHEHNDEPSNLYGFSVFRFHIFLLFSSSFSWTHFRTVKMDSTEMIRNAMNSIRKCHWFKSKEIYSCKVIIGIRSTQFRLKHLYDDDVGFVITFFLDLLSIIWKIWIIWHVCCFLLASNSHR